MSGIAIYVEGGGDNVQQKAQLRKGFDMLLKPQKDAARSRSLRWKLVPCGGRNAANDAFINALKTDPSTINVLLVDSEKELPIETLNDDIGNAKRRVNLLVERDGWDMTAAEPERIHLMVQCMEAWIVADPDALTRYYGQYFNRSSLPARNNLEEEPKQDIYNKLEQATSDKRIKKGQYLKQIEHESDLLALIDPDKVTNRCPNFAVFTKWLEQTIAGI
jgi:hypothetical protein